MATSGDFYLAIDVRSVTSGSVYGLRGLARCVRSPFAANRESLCAGGRINAAAWFSDPEGNNVSLTEFV